MTLPDTLAAAVQRGSPVLYLDSNVLLDIIRPERRQESRTLLDRCRQESWECASSYFALMEALDVEQESMWFRSSIRNGKPVEWLLRRRRERKLSPQARGRVERAFYRRFVADVQDYISWYSLEGDGWDEAIRLALETDSSAPDCIHVAIAISAEADVLVTSDDPLRDAAAGEIETAKPEEVLGWFAEQPGGSG